MRGVETTCVGMPERSAERGVGDVADIAVALGLDPGPAFDDVENVDVIAVQRLCAEAGIGPRRAADIGDRDANARRPAADEARRVHLAAQPFVGKVGSEGVKAGVAYGQIASSSALAMISIAETLDEQCTLHRPLHKHVALVASSRWRDNSLSAPIVSSARVMTGLVTSSRAASPRTVCGGGSR